MDIIKKKDVIMARIAIVILVIIHLITWRIGMSFSDTIFSLWIVDIGAIAVYVIISIRTNNWNPFRLYKKNNFVS